MANALSISSSDVTHTGHPGHETSFNFRREKLVQSIAHNGMGLAAAYFHDDHGWVTLRRISVDQSFDCPWVTILLDVFHTGPSIQARCPGHLSGAIDPKSLRLPAR